MGKEKRFIRFVNAFIRAVAQSIVVKDILHSLPFSDMELETISAVLFYLSMSSLAAFIGFCFFVKKFTKPYSDIYCSKTETEYFDPVTLKREKFPSLQEKCSVNLSVIIPAFDEEKRLPSMLDECLSHLESLESEHNNYLYEIIIVNDGSKDQTSAVAERYIKKYGSHKIRLLELEYNRGKGGAVYMGVQSARGAVILFADADGATKFSDLAKLESALQLLLQNDYRKNPEKVAESRAIICGSRAHLAKEASATRSLFRTILMHGFHFLVWLFAVRSVRDTQCGFKLFTREAASLCFQSLHIERWAFDVELLFIAERYKIPIVEIAVNWTEIDGSKLVPFWSWLEMGRDLFMIWLRYRVGAWKLVELQS